MAGGFSVRLYRRDFSAMALPRLMQVEAVEYSWAAMGGPEEAELLVYAPQAGAAEAAGWLRCPVEIVNEHGELAWWGYVERVEIVTRGIVGSVGVALEGMANRVAATYRPAGSTASEVAPGLRAQTTWAEDAGSVAEYGRKELILALGAATTADGAAQARDAYLALARYPVAGVGEGGIGDRELTSHLSVAGPRFANLLSPSPNLAARVRCRGWWSTLAWQYYGQAAGREAADGWTDQISLGDVTGPLKIAQPVRVEADGRPWQADSATVRARVVGAPGDELIAQVCVDAGGAPGEDVARGSFANLGQGMGWVHAAFDVPVNLLPDCVAWLVLGRSGGAPDAANYFRIAVSEDLGYGRGACLGWDGSSWLPLAPQRELTFVLTGSQETTGQLADMVGSGQFITGVDMAAQGEAPGTCQYREGARTLEAETVELLRLGVSVPQAGGRRLLAEVGPDRRVRIYPEPGPEEAWRLLAGSEVRGARLENISSTGVVAGRWLELAGTEAFGDIQAIGRPSPVFIERCVIDVVAGRRMLYARLPEQPAIDLAARLRTSVG